MKRKYVYGLLALPILLVLIVLALVPSETRATFFTEFRHSARTMMGYKPETYGDGEKGLRSEHPEEYGHADASDTAGTGDSGTDDSDLAEGVDGTAESEALQSSSETDESATTEADRGADTSEETASDETSSE